MLKPSLVLIRLEEPRRGREAAQRPANAFKKTCYRAGRTSVGVAAAKHGLWAPRLGLLRARLGCCSTRRSEGPRRGRAAAPSTTHGGKKFRHRPGRTSVYAAAAIPGA